jgi:hypothetical protein
MSDPSYNSKTYRRQGGDVFTVDNGGTLQVLSGGRIDVASGGTINFGASSLGAVAYGSAVLTNGGSATVGVGFPIRGVAPIIVGLDGSISGVAVNTSLYASGSAILYGMSGTLATTIQRGTVGYTIFG